MKIASILFVFISMCISLRTTNALWRRLPIDAKRNLFKHGSEPSRISSAGVSLDLNLISNHTELVISHLNSRRCSNTIIDALSRICDLKSKRNSLIVEGDKARSIRKKLSQQIGILMKSGKESEISILKADVDAAASISDSADRELETIDFDLKNSFWLIPNLLDDRVPDGRDDGENKVVYTWLQEARKIGDTYLWHDELAQSLNGMDVEAAARISGARFSVLCGSIARLERALVQFFLDSHTARGYKEVSVPYIVSRSTLEGTGQLPKFEEDLFKVSHSVAGEDAFLIPTAEVPLTNLFRGQLLNASDLPIHLVSYSPCFRAEAGSYGRDTRGLLRQHQFHKVELVKICTPETSEFEHEQLTNDAEAILQSLKLPYRKVLLCSGDVGFSARICYDLEVWLPGQQAYREISSCSNCNDFQSRRMSLRYRVSGKGKNDKKTEYPHTLNGSGIAVGRALVAILENYQEADGSVTIPEVLRPYMGGLERLAVSTK